MTSERTRETQRRYRERNRELLRERDRAYKAANRETVNERARQYRAANPEAHREANRRWREKDPEHAREKTRRWRAANLEQSRASARESVRRWREANPDTARQMAAELRQQLRAVVFDHYGHACGCPGCDATTRLTIDHVDGQGTAHRAALFNGRQMAGWHFYAWLAENGFPGGFQVLCRPCNASKRSGERCRLDHAALTPAQEKR
jgi:hypothetical protein